MALVRLTKTYLVMAIFSFLLLTFMCTRWLEIALFQQRAQSKVLQKMEPQGTLKTLAKGIIESYTNVKLIFVEKSKDKSTLCRLSDEKWCMDWSRLQSGFYQIRVSLQSG